VCRVKIATADKKTLEGTIYTYSSASSTVAISTSSTSGSSNVASTYHFIPTSQILSVSTLSAEKDVDVTAPLPQLDSHALRVREAAAIDKLLQAEQKKGKGVTGEAQELFNYFDRMFVQYCLHAKIHANKVTVYRLSGTASLSLSTTMFESTRRTERIIAKHPKTVNRPRHRFARCWKDIIRKRAMEEDQRLVEESSQLCQLFQERVVRCR
jgi:Anticodon-binding domain